MRARSLLLLAVLFLLAAPAARSQDARKIVEQYVKAAGGSRSLSRLRSVSIEGSVAPEDGGPIGTFTLDTRRPNRYYLELLAGNFRLIEAYNGKSSWRESEPGHPLTLQDSEASGMEAVAQIANTRLADLKANKLFVSWIAHTTVAGRPAEQIEVVTASGSKREEFFDSETHLLLQESAPPGAPLREIRYSGYRLERGLPFPRHLEIRTGSAVFRIEVTRITLDETIPDHVFDFPRRSQAKLPDLRQLFEQIDRNQKAIDKLKENYAGTRTEEQTEFAGDGSVKRHESSEYTFFFLLGHEVSTQVKKDGKPLSPAEQEKENERARKRVEEIQARAARRQARQEKAREEGKESNDGDDDDVGIEMFLRACQFINPRRERFRGQDVLVFDFEGNPEFKPRKLAEKIVQKLAGVIWIDEKALGVVRLEAYFTSDARIAGGLLVNLQRGTGFVFEQAFLNNEVWLPTYEEAHVGVRLLLVKGYRETQVTRYSDYQRFRVDSLSKLAPPKPR
ncbi:MAG TPA: hypothetical protein VLW54_11325 [Candidatus Acidoferrales bacterium]|nr:hypothetical protein [Candidatus Acidoferrales bacterium]